MEALETLFIEACNWMNPFLVTGLISLPFVIEAILI
ncbi:hypothetical protein FHS18_005559 [Paenibacillus phyllosphaerae]|uniref:Uncharacterized protein n=1 Tax=Paenibacillus phyllosphaerae TaxID=274593 RepID=A0A7W5B3A6_9BACL|nr:hypothetical protein [Paenibacillus phyllosphaerae]